MKNGNSGFTLVEIAVVMIVVGVLLAAAVRAYDLNIGDKGRRDTLENIAAVNSAITFFHANHDRYPCPARLDLAIGHPDYGKEIPCDPLPAGPLVDSCAGGICRASAAAGRDADNDGTDDNILIGGVPFVTLELAPNEFDPTILDFVLLDLSAQQILDGWGNKLTYAVSENLVQAGTFNSDYGAITVEDEFGVAGGRNPSLVDPDDSAHFIVLSHGSNGRGAYTPDGVLIGNPCTGGSVILPGPEPQPTVSSGATVEYENCNNDNLFISALRNDVTGNVYNDDVTSFQVFVSTDLWEFAPGTTVPGSIRNKNTGNVGIGTPTPEVQLHVAGKLKAERSISVRVCDEDGNGCFEPNLIAGDIGAGNPAMETDPPSLPDTDPQAGVTGKQGMKCSDPSFAMTGVADNKPNCSSPFSGFSGITATCPVGQFLKGVNSNGTIICEAF
ncbi:MAG: hypothetical protein DHS20C02_16700 [Micavibrio sp.]|nr:MAG: hypothetical protein DHS20C02_16700 [Micavibrio sp.]